MGGGGGQLFTYIFIYLFIYLFIQSFMHVQNFLTKVQFSTWEKENIKNRTIINANYNFENEFHNSKNIQRCRCSISLKLDSLQHL